MSCVMASMPVWAVTAGGTLTANSGSITTARGIIQSLRKLFLNGGSNDDSTAFLVASLPVPAVVGKATIGSGRAVILSPLPTPSRYSFTLAPLGCVAIAATALARSIADPPPTPITRSPSPAPACRNRSAAASTSGTSGSRLIVASNSARTPCSASFFRNSSTNPAATSVRDPTATNARLPSVAVTDPISGQRPQPNTIRAGEKKS